jgi:C1A family cysteine protease
MKRATLIAVVMILMLSLLYLGAPGAAQEPQFQEAPKRVTVDKSPDIVDGHAMGFTPPPVALSHLTGQRMPGDAVSLDDTLPSSFDWRDYGKVTSVKDQGYCGSCWAFASIANVESKMLMDGQATLPDPDYSENNAKECNYAEINNISGGTSCDGGNYYIVADLLSKKGTVLESCDPYVASDVDCKDTCPYQETLLDWRIICEDVIPDTNVLKAYIQTYGPVYTAMYAGFYEFSIYDGTYTLHYTGTETPNHVVLIVGWDDNLSYPGGTGGWIAKNSWGTEWGDEGYFTIAYGSASIGMYSAYLYDWQEYDSNDNLYYYDDCGFTNAWGEYGGLNTTCWGLCVFTPIDNAPIERVEFWTTDITTDVDVYLYDDFDGANLSNLLASKLNNSFDEAGYHSVEMDTPVPISTGDDVVAVVKFTNFSYGYPLVADYLGPIETGRTYISLDGSDGSWLDLGYYFGNDIAIRVRTRIPCLPGDANEDGAVDYLDLQVEKQIILGQSPPTCGADANGDENINILDLVEIKLIIMGP